MPGRTVITIGNFDGVHLGHRAILRRARAIADDRGLRVLAMPFDPHPATVLRPGAQPPRLMLPDQKFAALRAAGAHEVVILEPSPELLHETPEQFVRWLIGTHDLGVIVEGPDFRFGKDRAGDMDRLRELAPRLGFEVVTVDPVDVTLHDQLQAPVRSSLARWLLAHGRVADAALCLAGPFTLPSTVVAGEQRGRTIGVPTANLDLAPLAAMVAPADGVYAGFAQLTGQSGPPRRLAAAISIGVKPTFAGHARVIEAHLLDFDEDIYGQPIALELSRWLRDQQPFPGLDALAAQLQRDIARVRGWRDTGLLECAGAARFAATA